LVCIQFRPRDGGGIRNQQKRENGHYCIESQVQHLGDEHEHLGQGEDPHVTFPSGIESFGDEKQNGGWNTNREAGEKCGDEVKASQRALGHLTCRVFDEETDGKKVDGQRESVMHD
jgi:hypothetical protein